MGSSFKGLQDFIATLHSKNQSVVAGMSLALAGNYSVFSLASQKDYCLVNSTVYRGKPVIGVLDNQQVYYVDPFKNKMDQFLKDTLPAFYSLLGTGFDGLALQDAH